MPTLQGQVKSLPFSIKSYQTKDKQLVVEGYASKPIVDRVDDVVLPEAFKSSVERFKQNPALMPSLRLEHKVAVGTITDLEIRNDGLYVKGVLASGYPEADKARAMVEQGVMRFFSIGFIPKDVEYGEHEGKNVRFIKDLDLLEISLTDLPACQDALFTYTEKGIDVKVLEEDKDNIPEEQKAVCGKTDWPLADRDRAWDKSEAWRRIKQWVTDGTGDLNKLNITKMKQIHFYCDEKEPKNVTSYKLLFCDYIDNKVYAIPRAIFACAVVIEGGRGGLNIPEKDLAGVKRKVAHYYHRLGEKAPWEREKSYYLPEEVEPLVEIKLAEKLAKQKEQEQEQIQEEKLNQLLKAVSDLHKLIKSENEEGN